MEHHGSSRTTRKGLAEKGFDPTMIAAELRTMGGDQGMKMFIDLGLLAHRTLPGETN
jgi:hypothetical protein